MIMIPYCQKDPRWGDMTIGKTSMRMRSYGCLVTSLAILDGRTPDVVLDLLNGAEAFTWKRPGIADGLLIHSRAAEALGMFYGGIRGADERPDKICIAETARFRWWGFPQHFFVWTPEGKAYDPLDGQEKINPYQVTTYRMYESIVL